MLFIFPHLLNQFFKVDPFYLAAMPESMRRHTDTAHLFRATPSLPDRRPSGIAAHGAMQETAAPQRYTPRMHTRGSLSPSVQRRLALISVGVCIVPLGLAARFLLDGWMGDGAGGILYAVLVYFLIAVIAPGWRPMGLATLAWGACCAAELLQLTPIPRELAAALPPIRLVLGTTFVAADLLAYATGAVVAAIMDRLIPGNPRMMDDSSALDNAGAHPYQRRSR
jgi:hypothetical protein